MNLWCEENASSMVLQIDKTIMNKLPHVKVRLFYHYGCTHWRGWYHIHFYLFGWTYYRTWRVVWRNHKIKTMLEGELQMKNLGEVHYFFSIEIIHKPSGIWLSQRHHEASNVTWYAGCKEITTSLRWNMRNQMDNGMTLEDQQSDR